MTFSFDKNYFNRDALGSAAPIPTAVVTNKLEALKLLADLILAEVAILEQSRNVTEADEMDLAREVERFETDIIRCALVRTRGRQRKAARLLNIKPTTFHAKLRRYGILQEKAKGVTEVVDDDEGFEN